jgi:hypothetical protein
LLSGSRQRLLFLFFKFEFRFWTFDVVTCSKLGQSFFIASTCNNSEP